MENYPIIAFEGVDFAGKSTILKKLSEEYPEMTYLHEPGGTPISEEIADLLARNGKKMQLRTKTMLFEAARSELVAKLKELQKQSPIILDRFVASTLAYQSFGDGQNIDDLAYLNNYVLQGLKIKATVLFDISMATMKQRRASRQEKIDELDNYDIDYYRRVRDGYNDAIAKTPTEHTIVINANQNAEKVYADTKKALSAIGVI